MERDNNEEEAGKGKAWRMSWVTVDRQSYREIHTVYRIM